MKDFCIVYEHRARELDSVLLLKHELIKRGYSVEILHFPYPHFYYLPFCHKRAKVLVVSAAHDNAFMFRIAYHGFRFAKKIVDLRWEQVLPFQNNVNPKSNYNYPHEIAMLTKHLCWGKRPYALMKEAEIKEENLIVTGPIHMDFFRKEFCGYFIPKNDLFARYGLDPGKETILFISSFPFTSLSDTELQNLKVELSDEYVDGFVKISNESQEQILQWFDKYLGKHPEKNLIYRCHPAEIGNQKIKDIAKKHSNFRIINDYSIGQWITTCDKILSWYSTASAEVFFAKKSLLILRPVPVPKPYEIITMTNAHFVTSYQQMEDELEKTFVSFPIDESEIYGFYDVQKKPSYKRVVDYLENVLHDPKATMRWKGCRFAFLCRHLKEICLFFPRLCILSYLKIVLKKHGGIPEKYPAKIRKLLKMYDIYNQNNARNSATNEEIATIEKKIDCILQGD